MGITTGLFSDVLANAPQAFHPSEAALALSSLARPTDLRQGSADWSKTLPMAGAVDWANVRPFQVINPLTGYSYGATQPTQASSSSSSQEDKPQLSEYQKWLAQQSKPDTNMTGDHGEGRASPTDYGAVIGDPSASGKAWGELTSAQQAAYSAAVDPHGIGPMLATAVTKATPVGWLAQYLTPKLNALTGWTSPDEKAQRNAQMNNVLGDYAVGQPIGQNNSAPTSIDASGPTNAPSGLSVGYGDYGLGGPLGGAPAGAPGMGGGTGLSGSLGTGTGLGIGIGSVGADGMNGGTGLSI